MQLFIVIFRKQCDRGLYTDNYQAVVEVSQTFVFAKDKSEAERKAEELGDTPGMRHRRIEVYGEGEIFELGEFPA